MLRILEIAQQKLKGGRVPVKIALLEIAETVEKTNDNGLHWVEEYVLNNIESASNMGIFAEFSDEDKEIPYGHGLTGTFTNKDGIQEPEFKNSEGVGVIESASIEDIVVNDKQIRALVGTGYLYGQRYPEFVNWLRENKENGGVDTSIEIVGKKENDGNIIYAEGENATQAYRTPKEFDFSGTAILSIPPADENARLLEIAEKLKKEDEIMDKELKDLIVQTITETNSKNAEYEKSIAELNTQLAEKDSTISELNASVEELTAALEAVKKEQDGLWAEREELEKQLGEAKAEKRLREMEVMLSAYSEAEQKCAEAEIEAFKNDPLNCDLSEINNKICVAIVEKAKADEKAEAERQAEINSKQEETESVDIFGYVNVPESEDKGADVSIF